MQSEGALLWLLCPQHSGTPRPPSTAQQLPSITTCDALSFFLCCGITLLHLFKKQEFSIKKNPLQYDPVDLFCLHRNIHSSLEISTDFHLCLGQVTYKYKDNDKGLLFLGFLVARMSDCWQYTVPHSCHQG